MDIKDFILIGGGLLIAAVVAHGFWIAWRARRDPLRIDLVTDIPAEDDGDDLRRLRAELPNGGARVVRASEPRQESLGLDADLDAQASEPLESSERAARPAGRAAEGSRTEPRLGAAPTARAEPAAAGAGSPQQGGEPAPRSGSDRRGRVADVIMPERSGRAEEAREPRRRSARKATQDSEAPAARPTERLAERLAERPAERPVAAEREPARSRGGERAASRPVRGGVQSGERKPEPAVDELIMVNVMAPKGAPFTGGGLVESLRARGLRYGDMNIFHRVDPMTRATVYSVANVVEPGTFDLADLDGFRSPGVCFFMKLPGPEQPMEVFEDMLKVARDVAVRMGGELKDEQRSVMTGQTVEHYRQRISDFCRRRMSMRA